MKNANSWRGGNLQLNSWQLRLATLQEILPSFNLSQNYLHHTPPTPPGHMSNNL